MLWPTSPYMLRLCINPRSVMQYISSIHLMHVQKSMRKSCRYTQCIRTRILYYKSCEILNQVVQLSHAIHIRYCKSYTLCLNVKWNRRFVWWNHNHSSTKLYLKNITHLLPCVHTHSITDAATESLYFLVQLCTVVTL